MLDIQTISIVIASLSIVIAAIYYILVIRHQKKARQTDLIFRLLSVYNSKDFQEAVLRIQALDYKDYDDFVKKYGSLNALNELHISLGMVGNFYETVGVLVSEKLLDINLVQKLFTVEPTWKKGEPLIREARKQGSPELYVWFENLYKEMKKKEQQQSAS